MSFISDLLAPGGAILLIPYIRYVLGCLIVTTTTAFCIGFARLHMGILTFLAGGLWIAIGFFMTEFEKIRNAKESTSALTHTKDGKTD